MVTGLELSRSYFDDVIRPALDDALPGLPYAAARLGGGSEVLGLDDETSTDHDWGPQLSIPVAAEHHEAVLERLEEAVPETYAGRPTRFATAHDPEMRLRVTLSEVGDLLRATLGFDPLDSVTTFDWLRLTGQAVLEVTSGEVFMDRVGDLCRARTMLTWYPDDVWAWAIACDWHRLDQELPLMSRAGHRDDDLGSRVIAARLVHIAMHLGFLLERTWPPYAKWFGTSFARLPHASDTLADLRRCLVISSWEERQDALADALRRLLLLQKGRGLLSADGLAPFFDRPYLHVPSRLIADLLSLAGPTLAALTVGTGTLEQRTTNVDVLLGSSDHARIGPCL